MAIGNGTPAMAKDFVEKFSIRTPVYTDPERNSYALAGLKRNFGLGLRSLKAGTRAMSKGFIQGRTRGDPWQQGGALLVDTAGQVRWRHVDQGAGDHTDPQTMLAAVRTLMSAK